MESSGIQIKTSGRSTSRSSSSRLHFRRGSSKPGSQQMEISTSRRPQYDEDEDGIQQIESVQVPYLPTPAKTCRICLQQNDPMVTPCNCRGSVQYVHEQCLKSWIEKSHIAKRKTKQYSLPCQMCQASIQYSVQKKKTCKKECLTSACKRDLRSILVKIGVLIFLPLTFGFLAAVAFQSFQTDKTAPLRVSVWLAIVAMAITLILLFVFIWLLYLFITDYLINKEIKITLNLNKIQQPTSRAAINSSSARNSQRRVVPESVQNLQL